MPGFCASKRLATSDIKGAMVLEPLKVSFDEGPAFSDLQPVASTKRTATPPHSLCMQPPKRGVLDIPRQSRFFHSTTELQCRETKLLHLQRAYQRFVDCQGADALGESIASTYLHAYP